MKEVIISDYPEAALRLQHGSSNRNTGILGTLGNLKEAIIEINL